MIMRMFFIGIITINILIYGCQNKEEIGSTQPETNKNFIKETESFHNENESKMIKINEDETLQMSQKVENNSLMEETKEIDGKSIFVKKGCASCHQGSIETVGPSLEKISRVYNKNKEELLKFLKGLKEPIVEPGKFGIMKPQLENLKELSQEELEAIAEYIVNN